MSARALVLLATLLWASSVHAQSSASEEMRPTPAAEDAKGHFERALEHYRAGKYRSAIVELETAYGLDPTGKDLAYNLAVVYEKLGDLESAIHYLERYVEIETDEAELERAHAAIVRLRGARRELPPTSAAPAATAAQPAPCAEPAAGAPGRFDEWVMATGGFSVAAAVVGAVFGIRALAIAPSDSSSTSSSESIDDLHGRAASARRSARIADVAFALSVASGSVAAVLYFGRSEELDGATTVGFAGSF